MVFYCGASQPSAVYMAVLMLYMLLLMVASLSAVPHGHDIETRNDLACSEDFSLYDSYCYHYSGYGAKQPFHQAEKLCGRYRSTLVSIHNVQEEVFVVQLAENNTAFWIGLNDEEGPLVFHKEGLFKWTNGKQFTVDSYHNWRPGEPNNRKHLDCVKADHRGWAMANGGCAATRLPFVCKKQACPGGLEWGGASCDIISNAGKIPQTHWTTPQQSFVYSLAILWLLLCSMLVAMAIYHRTRTRTLRPAGMQTKDHLPPHGVQDVLPLT